MLKLKIINELAYKINESEADKTNIKKALEAAQDECAKLSYKLKTSARLLDEVQAEKENLEIEKQTLVKKILNSSLLSYNLCNDKLYNGIYVLILYKESIYVFQKSQLTQLYNILKKPDGAETPLSQTCISNFNSSDHVQLDEKKHLNNTGKFLF